MFFFILCYALFFPLFPLFSPLWIFNLFRCCENVKDMLLERVKLHLGKTAEIHQENMKLTKFLAANRKALNDKDRKIAQLEAEISMHKAKKPRLTGCFFLVLFLPST